MKISSLILSGFAAMIALPFSGCISFQSKALYDQPLPADTRPNIAGFYAVNIFSDYLSSEVWHTENASCISVTNIFSGQKSGDGALQIKWDKPQGGCTWIGMGIGWNDWAPKDMHAIADQSAVQFWVRNIKGTSNGLPWAVCLEDYSGAQAWTGVTPNNVEGGKITENWTQVTIPVSSFDFKTNDADIYSIKQMIIQFESRGEVMIDDIHLVPFTGSLKKNAQIYSVSTAPVIDGIIANNEWPAPTLHTENAAITILSDDNNLYILATVTDSDPLNNIRQNEDIWNGDAVELAFSTNPDADEHRTRYLFSDQHIGISACAHPMVWNWTGKKIISGATISTHSTATGYNMEASIPWKELNTAPWKAGVKYGLEVAVDDGNAAGSRKYQYRWNNSYAEGFNINPSLWGEATIQ